MFAGKGEAGGSLQESSREKGETGVSLQESAREKVCRRFNGCRRGIGLLAALAAMGALKLVIH
jgi:hypothetical protein